MKRLYPLLFFGGVMVLAFWKVIFHSEFTLLIGGDVASAYYPWFDVAAYWFKKGVLLLWDPYVYAGKPFMGEPQPGIFYPLNWIFMLLPARGGGISFDGLQALIVLDYVLLGTFFYLLARSFELSPWGAAVAGISFALGGFTAAIYGYVNILGGFVWMPLVMLCFRKALLAGDLKARIRWTTGSGACLALSFLAGHHVPPLHTGLLLFFYWAFRLLAHWKRWAWKEKAGTFGILCAVGAVGIGLTVFQWLPSAEWARDVYRWIGEGPAVRWGEKVPYSSLQRAGNLAPQDVLSLLLPHVSLNASIYIGSIVLFLCLVGLLFQFKGEARFFAFMAFGYLLLSWGRFSVLHGWVNTFIPGAWFAREVFFYLIPFHACIALLAGWGLDYLVRAYVQTPERAFRIFVRRAGWGMAGLAVVSWSLMAALNFTGTMALNHPYVSALATLATYVTILGFLLFLLHTGRLQPRVFRGLIVGLVLVDLSSRVSIDMPGKNRPVEDQQSYVRRVWRTRPVVEFLKAKRNKEGEFFRLDDPSQIFPPNYGDVWRLDATMGHAATALVDYFAFRGAGWGPSSNASALLNVRYFPSRFPIAGMQKVFEGDEVVYYNPRAVRRAFVASRYRSFSDKAQILDWIRNPLFSPEETVLVLEQDLEKLPPWFHDGALRESDGVAILGLSRMTAAARKAVEIQDPQERHRLEVFSPPWGWSAGDEITVSFLPIEDPARCFAIINYYPTGAGLSVFDLIIETAGVKRAIPVKLPGLRGGEPAFEPRRTAVVDLGMLGAGNQRLSLSKPEGCGANIDSLRISTSAPDPHQRDAGTVEIVSYHPHRIELRAALSRPSFVVMSEVHYRGWEAWVDGRPAPLLTGNYILRTVAVPAGSHSITFRYRPKSFLWGLAVTCVFLSGIVVTLIRTRAK